MMAASLALVPRVDRPRVTALRAPSSPSDRRRDRGGMPEQNVRRSMNVHRLDHVSFTVGELDRSIAFYRRFGFEPLKRYPSAGPDADEGTATANADMDIVWLRRPT